MELEGKGGNGRGKRKNRGEKEEIGGSGRKKRQILGKKKEMGENEEMEGKKEIGGRRKWK